MRLPHRQLGSTDLMTAALALGTVKLGRNTDVKYPEGFELPDDRTVQALLDTARELGINMVDTAPAYGESESRLGALLPGNREDWLICTKAGEFYENRQSRYDFSGDAIELSVQQSLERLDTDYLDIVLIHSDGKDLDILNRTDAMPTLQRLKDRGLVRYIGMSTKTVEGGLTALQVSDVLMVTFNEQDVSQKAVIEAAHQLNKGILLKKVLASGHGNATSSLKFALSEPGVHSAVIGTINPDHLRDNVEVASQVT